MKRICFCMYFVRMRVRILLAELFLIRSCARHGLVYWIMLKSDIKIADDLCIMVNNPITGYTKVDVVKVEKPNRKSVEEGLVVYFNKADERKLDTLCYIDLTIPTLFVI